MTSSERLQLIAEREPLPAAAEDLTARIREAVLAELEDVVSDLERHAEKTEKLYRDLGMDGEREAFAYRIVARDIRQRIEFMK